MEKFFTLEVQYLFLFTILLLLPKILLRFKIPVGISSLFLGIFTTFLLGWFKDDQMILMLSRLGITSLFLFAGMEIEIEELKKDAPALSKHILKVTIVTLISAFAFFKIFNLPFRPAVILALAILTPSTGFILNSLKNFGFNQDQEYWIRSKAIAKEIAAIVMLFIVLQSESIEQFVISKIVLIVLILVLPILFKLFFKIIAPYAPDSEVGFLILIALICGVITKNIGTYYLVGAFIVGVIAGQFKKFSKSSNAEHILPSLRMFFSFFIPFYFYHTGLGVGLEIFSIKGIILGLVFLIIFIPIRILTVFSSIKFFIKDNWKDRYPIATALLPTLIFGLVLVSILKERFNIDSDILGGVMIYTIVSSIIPSIVFKRADAESIG